MHKLLILITGLLFLGSQPALQAHGIAFETGDFETARARAAKEGKMLMLVVCADWLEVCGIMENDIFTNEAIGAAFNPHFVSWQLDAAQIEGNPYFGGVKILNLPEFIFFDSKGNPQYREKKLHDHDEMLAMAIAARNPANHLDRLHERYKSGNRAPDFVQRYIVEMDAAGHDMRIPSREYLKKVPREQLLETTNWIIATIGVQSILDPEFQYVVDNKSSFAKQYGEGPVIDFLINAYRNSFSEAINAQNAALLASCKKLVLQLLPPEEAKPVILQDELSYHAAGKNWPAYQKVAVDLFAVYTGEDAALFNDVAWAFHEHLTAKEMLLQAQTWAQRSIELQPASWNFHTLASLQLKSGDPASAEKSAQRSLELSEPDSEEAAEAQKLLDRIRNSR